MNEPAAGDESATSDMSAASNASATGNSGTTERQVQLGCGSLILIAIIVMIFSGADDNDRLERSIDELQTTVERLEQKLDELAARVP